MDRNERKNFEDNKKKFEKKFLYEGNVIIDEEKKKLDSSLKDQYENTPVMSSFISPQDNEIYCKLPIYANLKYIDENKLKFSNFEITGNKFGDFISININQLDKDAEGFFLDFIGNIFIPSQNILFNNLKPNLLKINIVSPTLSYKSVIYKNDDKELLTLYNSIYSLKNVRSVYQPAESLLKVSSIHSAKGNDYFRLERDANYLTLYSFVSSGILDDNFYIFDENDIEHTRNIIKGLNLSEDFNQYCNFYLDQEFLQIIDLLKDVVNEPSRILRFLKEKKRLSEFIKKQNLLKEDKKFVSGIIYEYKFITTTLVIFHSDEGKSCPSIDTNTGEIHKSEIDNSLFRDTKAEKTGEHIIDNYWHAFADLIEPYNLHHVLEPGIVLANQFDIEESMIEGDDSKRLFDNISLEGDLDEGVKMIDDIINEATNNKIWTIPYKAKVEIQFGSFTSLIISEHKNKIFFLLNHSNGRSFYGSLNVDTKTWDVSMMDHLPMSFKEEDEDKNPRIRAALKLLIVSIIRDFWVVEVRESVFNYERRNIKRKLSGQKTSYESIKYIPRVKYIRKIGVKNLETGLNYAQRRSHWVVAHLRKIDGKTSDAAKALAKNYGFEIQENFTFVKPHERGGLRGVNVKYRSKSALKLLFQENVTISPGDQTPDWFKFEIDVNKWLLRNKFETMHTGGAGDGGKDIVATKIIDKEVKTFLFECKCWKDKVGISVLRKLVGTLTDYPPDTLGGVITTSTFTRDAIEYAEKKSLLLIDGDKLVKLSFLN